MRSRRFSNFLPFLVLGVGLSACDGNLDFDLRGEAGSLDTSAAARAASAERPRPDERGVISYPNFQVALAQRGDTIQSLADRINVDAGQLGRFNGLRPDAPLNGGEVIALPKDVFVPTEGVGELGPDGQVSPVDITQIATTAIGRAPQTTPTGPQGITQATPSQRIDGPEPIRHRVQPGETAYTIARLYKVSVRSLAEWNGLGPDLAVRKDQQLLIPVTAASQQQAALTPVANPGAGSATPVPPSAATPLPPAVKPAPVTPVAAKPTTEAKPRSRFSAPAGGKILRPYKRGTNDGIDIAAAAGSSVRAAADGEVAAITRDTDQVAILVVRHPGNVLTVYANISDISVKKGDTVKRGQTVAKVSKGNPPFVHFEIREQFESIDPTPFLQ